MFSFSRLNALARAYNWTSFLQLGISCVESARYTWDSMMMHTMILLVHWRWCSLFVIPDDPLQFLRDHQFIDYTQLRLKYKLMRWSDDCLTLWSLGLRLHTTSVLPCILQEEMHLSMCNKPEPAPSFRKNRSRSSRLDWQLSKPEMYGTIIQGWNSNQISDLLGVPGVHRFDKGIRTPCKQYWACGEGWWQRLLIRTVDNLLQVRLALELLQAGHSSTGWIPSATTSHTPHPHPTCHPFQAPTLSKCQETIPAPLHLLQLHPHLQHPALELPKHLLQVQVGSVNDWLFCSCSCSITAACCKTSSTICYLCKNSHQHNTYPEPRPWHICLQQASTILPHQTANHWKHSKLLQTFLRNRFVSNVTEMIRDLWKSQKIKSYILC